MPTTNSGTTQNNKNIFPNQKNHGETNQTHGGVGQDKARISSARTASDQPASLEKESRARLMNSNSLRSQNRSLRKQKAEQLTLWVKPIVKAELHRIAKKDGLSVSAAGGAFLEKALQQHIDMHYGAFLQPIIEQAIAREMRTISTRLAWLLVRVAFDAGPTRSMVTNILEGFT